MVTAAIAAACTLLALAPLRLPFIAGILSFLLTVALNELPFFGFLYLLVTTLLTFSQNGAGPGSWTAAGLSVVAAAGLVVIARRALRAGPAVARALDGGLGAGWRGRCPGGRRRPRGGAGPDRARAAAVLAPPRRADGEHPLRPGGPP